MSTDGQPLDELFAHPSVGGKNLSPQLAWSGFPGRDPRLRGDLLRPGRARPAVASGTGSLVNLPVSVTELTARRRSAAGRRLLRPQRLRRAGYGGAAPPPGDRRHRYVFAVHAIDVDELEVGAGRPARPYVGFNLAFHTLARATIRPTFQVRG